MKVSKELEFPVVALPGVGRMPAKGEDEQAAARVFYVAVTRATRQIPDDHKDAFDRSVLDIKLHPFIKSNNQQTLQILFWLSTDSVRAHIISK